MIKNSKVQKRERLHKKIRSQISGTAERPRLSVFRSNKFIYAQLVDDISRVTLASASDISLADKLPKLERAKKVGALLATNASKVKITQVVFDRGGFAYKGRVRALAEAAREAGLSF
jgi:large subunit ribosomal protein L18